MSQTVDRAMEILQLVASGPQSLGTLADQLNVSKSTALRLAQSLERAGLVWKRENGRYALGSTILSLASKALESYDIREVARPYLTRLNKLSGNTIHLASLIDREAIYVDKYESTTAVRMYSRIGKTVSQYASGVGKVILAHQPEALQSELIARITFQRYTQRTIPNELALRRELAAIRERGWGTDDGEFEDTIHCIAAPIYLADSSVMSAVSISAPSMVASLADLERLLPELLAATDGISRANGWRGAVAPRGQQVAQARDGLEVRPAI